MSVFGEFYWRDGFRELGPLLTDPDTNEDLRELPRNGYGASLQAGYLLPRRPIAIAARYSQVRSLGDRSSLSDKNSLGAGVSYYFAGHPLKIQGDYFRIWGGSFSRGADQVRVQLQMAY